MVRLEGGDCIEVIPRLAAEGIIVDAIVTDPPYNLTNIDDWKQRADGGLRTPRGERHKIRKAAGFMGQTWDGTSIAFRQETWVTIATILRPGGFLLAFGGTRTSHRMVCAIEDAGFVIQDTIMWLYGSGFPKGRTLLKPAFEPICIAYKPGGKRALQIDDCRISTNGEDRAARYNGKAPGGGGLTHCGKFDKPWDAPEEGRWPANIVHDGGDEVLEAFASFGEKNNAPHGPGSSDQRNLYGADLKAGHPGFNDCGSAARFFFSAKAGPEDRFGSRHPTVKPVELVKYLVRLVCPKDGTFLDPFAGSGTSGVAAFAEGRNAILIEQDPSYCNDIRERLAFYEGEGRHSLASKNRAAMERGSLPLFDGT